MVDRERDRGMEAVVEPPRMRIGEFAINLAGRSLLKFKGEPVLGFDAAVDIERELEQTCLSTISTLSSLEQMKICSEVCSF